MLAEVNSSIELIKKDLLSRYRKSNPLMAEVDLLSDVLDAGKTPTAMNVSSLAGLMGISVGSLTQQIADVVADRLRFPCLATHHAIRCSAIQRVSGTGLGCESPSLDTSLVGPGSKTSTG